MSGARRGAGRGALVFVSTGSQAERAGQNGRNRNRFQKFQFYLASFPRWLLRLFRQGITWKQRFSRLFWMCII